MLILQFLQLLVTRCLRRVEYYYFGIRGVCLWLCAASGLGLPSTTVVWVTTTSASTGISPLTRHSFVTSLILAMLNDVFAVIFSDVNHATNEGSKKTNGILFFLVASPSDRLLSAPVLQDYIHAAVVCHLSRSLVVRLTPCQECVALLLFLSSPQQEENIDRHKMRCRATIRETVDAPQLQLTV